MLTLKFNDEDMPFVLAALRMRSNALLESVMLQIDMQRNPPKPPPPQEFKVDAPPVEATVTPKRGRGRPKGSKNSVKRRPPKSGVAK